MRREGDSSSEKEKTERKKKEKDSVEEKEIFCLFLVVVFFSCVVVVDDVPNMSTTNQKKAIGWIEHIDQLIGWMDSMLENVRQDIELIGWHKDGCVSFCGS